MRIIDQPNDLLPERDMPEWCWSAQDKNLFKADIPWYAGSFPIYKITGERVIGLIRWGGGALKVSYETEPCQTFSEARSLLINFAHMHFDRTKVDWHQLADRRSGGSIKGSVSFENCVPVGAPIYTCLIANLPGGKTVRSSACSSKKAAFEEAIVAAIGFLKTAPTPKSVVVDWAVRKASVGPPQKQVRVVRKDVNPAQNELTRLLSGAEAAKQQWLVEHEWLLKRVGRTTEEERRLKQLNEFLVLCDPLRKLEIDQGSLPSIFNSLMAELEIRKARTSDQGVQRFHGEMLRALAGKKFVEPGAQLTAGSHFEDVCGRAGLRPNNALALLKSLHLIRIELTGGISMSSPGANLLERMLELEHGPNTLASRLGFDTVVQLGDAVRRH